VKWVVRPRQPIVTVSNASAHPGFGARVAIEAGVRALPMEDRPELLVVGIEQVVEAIAEF